MYGSVGFFCGIIGQGIANIIMTARRSVKNQMKTFLFHLLLIVLHFGGLWIYRAKSYSGPTRRGWWGDSAGHHGATSTQLGEVAQRWLAVARFRSTQATQGGGGSCHHPSTRQDIRQWRWGSDPPVSPLNLCFTHL
ncbi:hypothetical protein PVAP13_3KG276754 [Panicum virgatum]|uniref:Uncharacterized protein n=1 Tax=Panicum virgatum TaxID=38727 RepID=A0A8T0UV80_PANVG|nr:hypothetical protein PVAP13_3KG276754 [Panicum virgatum]